VGSVKEPVLEETVAAIKILAVQDGRNIVTMRSMGRIWIKTAKKLVANVEEEAAALTRILCVLDGQMLVNVTKILII